MLTEGELNLSAQQKVLACLILYMSLSVCLSEKEQQKRSKGSEEENKEIERTG